MPTKRTDLWTSERIDKLIAFSARGLTANEIAQELGVTKAAVDLKRSRLKIKAPNRVKDTKLCTYCRLVKPRHEFNSESGNSFNTFCRDCGHVAARQSKYGSVLPRDLSKCQCCSEALGPGEAHIDHLDTPSGPKIRGVLCRACNTAAGYFSENAEIVSKAITYITTSATEFRAPDKIVCGPDRYKGYGLTKEDYLTLLVRQEHRCACCNITGVGTDRNSHVEHDHLTGVVRGICCGSCNKGLGMLGDSADKLSALKDYILNPPGVSAPPIPIVDRSSITTWLYTNEFFAEAVDLCPLLPTWVIDGHLVGLLDPTVYNVDSLTLHLGVVESKAYRFMVDLINKWRSTYKSVMLLRSDQFMTTATANRLRHLVGRSPRIGARQTVVRTVPSRVANQFYDTYHIQGSCNADCHLGLYHGDVLVGCMSFGHACLTRASGGKLLQRLAMSCNVPGAANKLLNAAKKLGFSQIITFADPLYTDGAIYHSLGFKESGSGKSDYFYYKNGTYFHKSELQRKALVAELGGDAGETERVMAVRAGYLRVYVPCKIKYVLLTGQP